MFPTPGAWATTKVNCYIWSQNFQNDRRKEFCLKNKGHALLSVITQRDFFGSHGMCPNSSNARCKAEKFFAYKGTDLCAMVNRSEPNVTGANSLFSHVFSSVCSSLRATQPAASSLAWHIMSICFSGRSSFSDLLAAFKNPSLISIIVFLCCCVNLKGHFFIGIKAAELVSWRVWGFSVPNKCYVWDIVETFWHHW